MGGSRGLRGRMAAMSATVVLLSSIAVVGPSGSVAAADVAVDYSAAVLADSPVGYWPLDETLSTVAQDASGYGNHGEYVGSPALAQSGAFDGSAAATFASGDRIEVPHYDFSAESFTVEAWIKTTSTASSSAYEGDPALTIFGDHRNVVWFSFGVDGGVLQISRFSIQADQWQHVRGVTLVNDGEWHHVVGTTAQGSNTAVLYVDGEIDAQGPMDVFVNDHAGVNRIGSGYLDQDGFVGSLDEVAIYSEALGPGQVAAHYAASGMGSPTVDYDAEIAAANPVLYHRLGEASGIPAVDSSGRGHHGSYVGGVSLGEPGALAGSSDTAAGFTAGGRVETASTTDLEFHGGSFSVEAWVTTTSTAAEPDYEGNPALTVFGDVTGTVWFSFGISDGKAQLARHGSISQGWQVLGGVSTVNDGEWHHLVGTLDASGLVEIYVDGVLDARAVFDVSGQDLAAVNRIGVGYNDLDPFDGLIDEAAVYGYALSPSVVRSHFRVGSGRSPLVADDILAGNGILMALQQRFEDVAAACPPLEAGAFNPEVTFDLVEGTCTIAFMVSDCGWRQYFCDNKDQLIAGIAVTAVTVIGGLAIAPAVAAGASRIGLFWHGLRGVSYTYRLGSGGPILATAGGTGGSLIMPGTTITVTAGGALAFLAGVGLGATTILTVEKIGEWVNDYETNRQQSQQRAEATAAARFALRVALTAAGFSSVQARTAANLCVDLVDDAITNHNLTLVPAPVDGLIAGEHPCQALPVYFPSEGDLGPAGQLRSDAIRVNPQWIFQQRRTTEHSRNWLATTPPPTWPAGSQFSPQAALGCSEGLPNDGLDCDEFPNAIMHAGGQDNQPALRLMEPIYNQREGGKLSQFFSGCNIPHSDLGGQQGFLVIPLTAYEVGSAVPADTRWRCAQIELE